MLASAPEPRGPIAPPVDFANPRNRSASIQRVASTLFSSFERTPITDTSSIVLPEGYKDGDTVNVVKVPSDLSRNQRRKMERDFKKMIAMEDAEDRRKAVIHMNKTQASMRQYYYNHIVPKKKQDAQRKKNVRHD